MSVEFEKDNKGQYHFLNLVKENGEFLQWYGNSGHENKKSVTHFSRSERLTLDDFLTRYQIPFDRFDPGNCFLTLGNEFQYPSGEDIQFVNKDTGLIMAEIFFEELDLAYLKSPLGCKSKEERKYKPRGLTEDSYEKKSFDHPILGEKVDGTMVTIKSWTLDKKFRRRERDDLRSVFVRY